MPQASRGRKEGVSPSPPAVPPPPENFSYFCRKYHILTHSDTSISISYASGRGSNPLLGTPLVSLLQ